MSGLIEQELSYKITGLCFKAQKDLGRFCKEQQYSQKLAQLLTESGLKFEREIDLKKLSQDGPDGNRIDFLIDGKIIVDLKAKPFITKDDYYQMQRYLHAADIKLGLIVNFRNFYLKPKRVINLKYDQDHSYHSNVN
jgi:GxxExxY protein